MTGGRNLLVLLFLILATATFALVSVNPKGLTFPSQLVGTTGPVQNVTLYNIGTTTFTVNTATVNLSQFKIVSGTLPFTLAPNQFETFQVQFTPDAAQLYNGLLTFTFTGATTQKVNLTASGLSSSAIPTLSTTALTFNNQLLGKDGPSQNVSITNTGTTTVKVTGVTITSPFTQTGWKSSTSLAPGKSLTLHVTFVANALGLTSGIIQLTYDIAPSNGVSLWGTAVPGTALGTTSFPNLPASSRGYPYQANLTATGGTPPYSWSLPAGVTLPSGLSLSSAGIISGTLASTVATGNVTFKATVTDSATPPAAVTATEILSVNKGPGSNCNTISFNAADGSGLLVPLTDLGTNSYLGAEAGGIYANGSNVDDGAHDAYGQGLAAAIQPLDSSGNVDPNGKYVLLGLGLSVTEQSFDTFVPLSSVDPAKNPSLVILDGSTGGATTYALTSLTNNVFWQAITNDYLPNAGVTANQVVAVWFMDVDGVPTGTFPSDMTQLQSQMETVSQNLYTVFPNLKIEYVSSMYYTGYSNGVTNLNNEPYAYESGFAVKNMVQDQLNGNSNLNFDPSLGAVVAPWMAWGPYLWANGMVPRSDGQVWTCHDLNADGTHPNSGGRIRVSQQLLNFLKTDDTAAPWFLAPAAKLARQQMKK